MFHTFHCALSKTYLARKSFGWILCSFFSCLHTPLPPIHDQNGIDISSSDPAMCFKRICYTQSGCQIGLHFNIGQKLFSRSYNFNHLTNGLIQLSSGLQHFNIVQVYVNIFRCFLLTYCTYSQKSFQCVIEVI